GGSRKTGPGASPPPAAGREGSRDAALDDDAEAFRRCLAEPLRSNSAARLAEARRQLDAVQHWSQYAPEVAGADSAILVDQVRTNGMIHRVSYRLRRSPSGWLVNGVGQAEIIRPPAPPGTPVNDAAGGREPAPEP